MKQKLSKNNSNINQEWYLTLYLILKVDTQYIECDVRWSVEDNPTKLWYRYCIFKWWQLITCHSLKWKELRCQDDTSVSICNQILYLAQSMATPIWHASYVFFILTWATKYCMQHSNILVVHSIHPRQPQHVLDNQK